MPWFKYFIPWTVKHSGYALVFTVHGITILKIQHDSEMLCKCNKFEIEIRQRHIFDAVLYILYMLSMINIIIDSMYNI